MLPVRNRNAETKAVTDCGMRVLMVLPNSPNPIRCRALEVLRELMRYAQVDILYLDDGSRAQLPAGVHNVMVVPNASKARRILRLLAGLARGYPIGPEYYHSLRLPRVLRDMDLSQYDAVYVKQLPLHRLQLRHPRIIYDVEDCWSNKSRVMASGVKGYQRILYAMDKALTPRHELAACNAASMVLVTAEREAEHIRKLGVTKPIEAYMHDRRCATAPRILKPRERLVVSFHGKLSYAPNAIALEILNNSIVPRLDAGRYEFRIVGQCPPNFAEKFPALTFTGYVDSMPDAIRRVDLSVFPMTISVGFPNKAMESLAAGVPFIATRCVVEGLPPMPDLLERGVYVREIADFADEVERFSQLSLSARQEIAERCHAHVHSVYSSSFHASQWQRLLEVGKAREESAVGSVA